MSSKLKNVSLLSKKIYKSSKNDKKHVTVIIKGKNSMDKQDFVKNSKHNHIEKLSQYASNKGIIIYGQITKVAETEIFVNLPENRVGKISIVHISESYKAQLKKSLDNAAGDISIHSLPQLFKVGQNIYCHQIKCNGRFSELSLVPFEINKQLKYNFITPGLKFYGAIKDKIADNEFLIETGIKHFKGIFKCNDEKVYSIGDFLFFCVNDIITSSTLLVEAKLRLAEDDAPDESDEATLNLYNIVPGTKVQYTVTKIVNNFITGTILFNETITAVLIGNDSTNLAVNDVIYCKIVGIVPTRIVYLQQDQNFTITNGTLSTIQYKSGNDVEINILGTSNNLVSYHIPEYKISSKAKSYDISYSLPIGTKLMCKIFDTSLGGLQLTNRLEYFFGDKNILSNEKDATVGAEFYGTVIKEFDKFFVVRFFDGITGTMSNKFIDKSQIYIGKVCKFIINGMAEKENRKQIYLKLAQVNDNLLGSVFSDAIVLCHNAYQMQVQLNQYDDSQIGYIPVGTLTNDMELDRILFSFFKDGSTIDCVQINNDIYKISNEDVQKDFEDIEEGDIIKGFIKNIMNGEVEIFVPIKHKLNQSVVLPFEFNKQHFRYFCYKPIFLKIFEKNTDSSIISYGIANLDTIWNGDLNTSIDTFENYLIYYSQVLEQLGFSLGDKIEGTITEIEKGNTKMNFNTSERAILEVNSRAHAINQNVTTFLTSITYTNQNEVIYNVIEKSKKIIINSNLEENCSFDCEIVLIKSNFVIARSIEIRAPLIYIPKFVHENDFNCIMSEYFKLNSKLKITYLRKFNNTIGIGLPTKFYRKYKKSDVKEVTATIESDNEEIELAPQLFVPNKRQKLDNTQEYGCTDNLSIPSVSNLWNLNLKSVCAKPTKDDDDDNSEKEDSTNNKTEKKSKKLTPVERRQAVKEEESRIREIEEKLADTTRLPESIDDYERFIMATPNDSSLWIKYMAFHLQLTEIDKARKVCHQGLKTISYREESDKLNLWIALLNLEIRYGSSEQFQYELNEALKVNDQFTVYTKSLEILFNSKKLDELAEMIEKVRRKFGKTHKQIWINIASIYFQLGENQKAIKLLGRAMTSLPEKDHVDTIIQFAILMNKNNESLQAHAHLDQILASYPKRIDVWCLYVDMLVKSNSIDAARNTLDRAVNLKLNVKKMKTIFKKYLEFEKIYGTEENVNKVKQLAEEYVEAKVQNK